MDLNELWRAALGEIELNVSRANFNTWLKNTSLASKNGGLIVIQVPNAFSKEWLENKYHKIILGSLRNVSPDVKEVVYEIASVKEKPDDKILVLPLNIENELPLTDKEIDKETNLNKKYTFSSFVVGSSNQLAHAAAEAIVKKPGETYNPLLIYGGVGLGKTHLLHAVGNEIEINSKSPKIIRYISSEKFTNDYITAITSRRVNDFREKYRQVDVLIIDDVQFLAGKEQTQEEFFHTFNTLYEQQKQIIISSDRPPKSIPSLEDRLRSRFEGGMIADIGYPDYEMRVAILQMKLNEKKCVIPDNIIHCIAENFQKSIRELEGALNHILGVMKIEKNVISESQIKKLLNSLSTAPPKILNPLMIIKIVSEFYNINTADLIIRSRKREFVMPRQIAMYLLRSELKISYPSIGEKLGGRDHTTAIHAYEKINQEINTNNALEQEINLIKDKIYNT